jgi:hypothetical protein
MNATLPVLAQFMTNLTAHENMGVILTFFPGEVHTAKQDHKLSYRFAVYGIVGF